MRVAFAKFKNSDQESDIIYESNKLKYKLYNKSVVVCANEWEQPKCHCDMLLTFQIYACGPRSYKTFHGFLHDSHKYILKIQKVMKQRTLLGIQPSVLSSNVPRYKEAVQETLLFTSVYL